MKNLFATAASVLVLGFAVPAMAQSSVSTVQQIGAYNGATVNQIGVGAINDSAIRQGLIDNTSSSNNANVQQNGTFVQRNTSDIDQDGNNNGSTVVQGGIGFIGDKNISAIKQVGSLNAASVNQGNAQLDNVSGITQSGSENWATVDQGGVLGNNTSNDSAISQSGYSNEAHVHQGGGLAVNTSTITQADDFFLGGNNYANVTQEGASSNTSGITQQGALNGATVTQNSAVGVVNNSTVSQAGVGNGTTVTQN